MSQAGRTRYFAQSATRGEECFIFLFPSSRASRSCRAPREISRSPRLAHKAPAMQAIRHFGKYHNTLCLSPQILRKHCFQFLLGIKMARRENKINAYAKFGGTNKRVLWYFLEWPISSVFLKCMSYIQV